MWSKAPMNRVANQFEGTTIGSLLGLLLLFCNRWLCDQGHYREIKKKCAHHAYKIIIAVSFIPIWLLLLTQLTSGKLYTFYTLAHINAHHKMTNRCTTT